MPSALERSRPGSRRSDFRRFKKSLGLQIDQSDCGVVCLASIVRYYGGYASLEKLREDSGTGPTGTTMLGLYQAAGKAGLTATGYNADLDQLAALNQPCILHVILDGRIQHFVVCYGMAGDRFVIGDPSMGIRLMTRDELAAVWTKTLLALEPNERLVLQKENARAKRKWFGGLLAPDWNILAISSALGIVIAVLGLSLAIFIQRLIDDILPHKRMPVLVAGLTLLSVLLLMKVVMEFVRQSFLVSQSVGFNRRVIRWFYASMMALPKSFFDSRKIGDFVARLNDGIRIQSAISKIAGNIVIDLFVAAAAIVYICVLERTAGVFLLLAILANAAIAAHFYRIIIDGQREIMLAYAATESNYIDTIKGIGVIKSANKERFFTSVTERIYGSFQKQQWELGTIAIRYSAVTELTGTLLSIGLVGWMSYLTISGSLALGRMVAALSVSFSLIPALARISLASIQVSEARVAFDRLYGLVLSEAHEPQKGTEEGGRRIEIDSLEVKDLKFRFPGRAQLLTGLSCSARKGTIVAIVGENGCGKSTLLQILERLYEPESGEIRVNGQLLWNEIPLSSWRTTVAAVPQEVNVFNGGFLFNICLSEEREELQEALRLCQELGFQEYLRNLPQGYLTVLGEGGVRLSGGQKQLIGLARALYRKPALLLLDEPTAAMDMESEAFVMNLLARLKTNKTILMVTHKIQTLRFADYIYVLGAGAVEAEGTRASLLETTNFYSRSVRELKDLSV